MGQGYSSDLRVRILGAIESGNFFRAAARRFSVDLSTSIRLAQGSQMPRSLSQAKERLASHPAALSPIELAFAKLSDSFTPDRCWSCPKHARQ